MNKFRIGFSLLAAAGAAVFALRHHSLRQLRVAQEQLQQQGAEVVKLRAAIVQNRAEVGVATIAPGLPSDERLELLRLRGQVGVLRQELVQATNQVWSPRAISSDPSEEHIVSKEERLQKAIRIRDLVLAMHPLDSTNNQRILDSLAELAPANGPTESENHFELVQGDLDMSSLKYLNTIALREKQPRKGIDGRWCRMYVFADGHTAQATSDTQDFTEWEKKQEDKQKPLVVPP